MGITGCFINDSVTINFSNSLTMINLKNDISDMMFFKSLSVLYAVIFKMVQNFAIKRRCSVPNCNNNQTQFQKFKIQNFLFAYQHLNGVKSGNWEIFDAVLHVNSLFTVLNNVIYWSQFEQIFKINSYKTSIGTRMVCKGRPSHLIFEKGNNFGIFGQIWPIFQHLPPHTLKKYCVRSWSYLINESM